MTILPYFQLMSWATNWFSMHSTPPILESLLPQNIYDKHYYTHNSSQIPQMLFSLRKPYSFYLYHSCTFLDIILENQYVSLHSINRNNRWCIILIHSVTNKYIDDIAKHTSGFITYIVRAWTNCTKYKTLHLFLQV